MNAPHLRPHLCRRHTKRWLLRPIRPDELLRYEANHKTPVADAPGTFRVKPLQTDFTPELSLPEGWTYHVQFEGQVFFYHEEKSILTETWLYNPELCQEIMAFIQLVDEFCEAHQIQIPPTSELVLELRQDSETGENYCAYYFARAETRTIFWLEEFVLDLDEVKGGQLPPQHVELYLQNQYWRHFEFFEAIQVTTPTVLRELREIILNSFADTLTSRLSTVTQSEAQLTNLLKIVEEASKDLNAGGRGCPLAVGKIMSRFSHERFLNFYGQKSPRLYRGQSIYHEPSLADRRSWSMSIISPILFYIPDVHLYSMDKVWVDQMAARLPWVKFIENLISEWKEHTTFATILLTVNVSFLDVPGVESEGPSQSLTQVFSSISLVLCAASAILGLILVRQQRTKRIGTADEAVEFFSNNHLEISAIIYSLPHALLLHGMGFFLLAFMLSCFLWTSTTTRLMVGIFCALACILVLWCIVWQACEDSMTVVPSWLNRLLSTSEPDRDETGEVNTNENAVAQIEKGFSSESLHNTDEIV
ncbi:hypothetical protein B0H14DRAFT_1259081 [Mycena olivaceomarginata]|nr:hypothetical protein B0H14DRAFT_1259081 [Mycena olivaceomarginata]